MSARMKHTPRSYAEAATLLAGRSGVRLGHNTTLEQRAVDRIAVRLYFTDVVTFCADGTVILSSGGTTGIRTTIIHTATAGKTTVTTRTATAMITVTTVMITASTAIGTGPGSGASSTGCSYRTATTPETQSTTPWRPATRESGHSKSVC